MNGWTSATTETLLDIRANLHRGLVRIYQHIEAGTAHDIPPNGHSSPKDGGFVTWILLEGCEAELHRRNALMTTPPDRVIDEMNA